MASGNFRAADAVGCTYLALARALRDSIHLTCNVVYQAVRNELDIGHPIPCRRLSADQLTAHGAK